jgi:hypothetical protein
MSGELGKISEVRLLISGIILVSYLFFVGESASAEIVFSNLKIEIVHTHEHNHGHGHDHHQDSPDEHQSHESPDQSSHSHELSLNAQVQAIVTPNTVFKISVISAEQLSVYDIKAPASPDRAQLLRPPIV